MRTVFGGLLIASVAACGTNAPARAIPGDHGSALKVEVLNASGRPGEARTGTRILRHAGVDVVYFGNAPEGNLVSTRIIVRRGTTEMGERIRAALGIGHVDIQLDSARLLDVSVLLGADFAAASRARPLDFHP